jgi:3-(3-hydroxy-phenyl)propionate hydroxylase
VRFIQVVPEVQIHCDQDNVPGVIRVGDTQNRLKSWFAQHDTAIAVVVRTASSPPWPSRKP